MREAETPGKIRQAALLRRWAAWGANRGPAWFVRGAPPVIGAVFALVSRDAREQVLDNLRLVLGRRSLLREALDVVATFVHFAHALTRSLAPMRPLLRAREFRVRGRHHVEPFLARGQGMLVVTAHVGPWDSAAMGLRLDAPVLMLMSPEGDQRAGAFQDEVRQEASVDVLRAGEDRLGVLKILDHLREGGVVVAQIDRVPVGRPGIEVDLFGAPFALPQGLFRVAAAAEVPLIPVFCARLPRGRALVDVGPPIFVSPKDRGPRLASHARAIAARLEAHLAAFPTQWFHFSRSRSASGTSPSTQQVFAGAQSIHLAKAPP